MKKILSIISGACAFVGVASLIGLAGHVEANGVTFALVGYGVIGVALILGGYHGLKLTGCRYID